MLLPEQPFKGTIQDIWLVVAKDKDGEDKFILVRGQSEAPFPAMTDDTSFLPQLHAIGQWKVDTGDASSYQVVHFQNPTIHELP